MSSSYVEVRDRENGMDDLDFQVNDYESNGIDIQTHFDGNFPKDHTYNKDPTSDMEFISAQSKKVEVANNEELPKKVGRAHRNVKHKIIKPRNDEGIPVEATSSEKNTASKVNISSEPISQKPPAVNPEKKDHSQELTDVNNSEPESNKKRNRKRKVEEPVKPTNTPAKKISSTKQTKKKKVKEENGNPPVISQNVIPENKEKDVKEENSKKKSKPAKAIKKVEKPPQKQAVEVPKTKLKPVKKVESGGDPIPQLPTGWTRKVVERKSGKTAGMFDVYIYSPDGIKFRSKPDVAAYLIRTKSKLKIEDFVFKRSAQTEKKPSEKPTTSKEPIKPKKKALTKKGAKLKVKISTPKRPIKPPSDESSAIESQPSTSGHQSKRKKRNT